MNSDCAGDGVHCFSKNLEEMLLDEALYFIYFFTFQKIETCCEKIMRLQFLCTYVKPCDVVNSVGGLVSINYKCTEKYENRQM